jgi:hypothetical protein
MHAGHGSVNSRLINTAAVCRFAGRTANGRLVASDVVQEGRWWRGASGRRDSGMRPVGVDDPRIGQGASLG